MGDAGERTPQEHALTGRASIEIDGSSADIGEQSVITDSQSSGLQTFSVEQTKLAQKAQADEHKRNLAKSHLDHDLAQQAKDNDLRRLCVRVVVVVIVGALLVSTVLVIVEPDPSKNQWAQGIATTILGSLLGAIAGYFAAKTGN
jgi:hypothetical protein